MPPWQMLVSVCRTAWRIASSPLASASRQSRSSSGACGNLGAPPRPPWIVSNACTRRRAVWRRNAGASAGPRLGLGEPRERLLQRRGVARHLVALVAPDPADGLQDLRQAGPAVARLRREVGAAPERLAVGRQEHGQRPAAVLAEQRQRMLVDLVEVRPLLAIDLDVDELRVHQLRDRRVLEALVGHDVAPVAGGVADREQDRLVLSRAAASAFSSQGCQWTGLSRCWIR